MRLNEKTRFPHPVLSPYSDDYSAGTFEVGLVVKESRSTGSVLLEYSVTIDEPSIRAVINDGLASPYLFIISRNTYYNCLHKLDSNGGCIEFSSGEILGKVVFRPVIVALDKIDSFSSKSLHDEYGDAKWGFSQSDIIAVGEDLNVDIGLDKLAPMETIFQICTDEDTPDGETRTVLDGEKISILASKDTHKKINALRGSGVGRLALLNGVYLPVVMEVLSLLSQSSGEYEGKRWHSVFLAKCTHENINIGSPNLLEDAQRLLRSPLKNLIGSKEFLS